MANSSLPASGFVPSVQLFTLERKVKEQKSKQEMKVQWNQNKICKGFDILCIFSKDLLEARAKAKPGA